MDYAIRINRLSNRLRIMGVVFAAISAVIFISGSGEAPSISTVLAVALMSSGLTAAISGEYLLRIIRKHPEVDQQIF